MNHQTSDTPETDGAIEQYAHLLPNWLATDIIGAVARRLERKRDEAKFEAADESRWAMSYKTQRDEWAAKAAELSAERESNAMQALAYKAERDALREALSACMEDSIELLGERGWWKDEPRSGYAERYAQTAENVIEAKTLLSATQK